MRGGGGGGGSESLHELHKHFTDALKFYCGEMAPTIDLKLLQLYTLFVNLFYYRPHVSEN